MRFCSNCGKKISDTTKFCPYCGAKQPVTPSQQPQQTNYQRSVYRQPQYTSYPRRHNNRKWYVIVAIIVILIIGFIGYQHSMLSVNLNSELPNNAWTVKDYQNTLYKVRFHNHSTAVALHKDGEPHTIYTLHMKPTSRHTAEFIDNEQGSHEKALFKVISGNGDHFKLKQYGTITGSYNGIPYSMNRSDHQSIVHIQGHSKVVHDKNDLGLTMTLTKTK